MAGEGREDGAGTEATLKPPRLQTGFLLSVVVGMTVLFVAMVRNFVVAVILGGVFAGMSRKVYLALVERLKGSKRMAALSTVLGLLLLIVVPVGAFLGLVVAQAIEVGEMAGPWIRQQEGRWQELTTWLEGLPFLAELLPDRETLIARASASVDTIGSFLINNVRAATTGTLNIILQLFVMLYAMYYFLIDGPSILSRILYLTPLDEADERKLMNQFVSVTRATIKGSILVGLIQGALAGAAFFVLGLPAAAFWTTVMAVLSVIPVLGSGIIWGPAAVILVSTGRVGAGIGLAIWGIVVVGMIDNFLRPRFIGRDLKMHNLLVLLSTFGGLVMFGVVGFIIGPIIAALLVTTLGLYGAAFRAVLPGRQGSPARWPG